MHAGGGQPGRAGPARPGGSGPGGGGRPVIPQHGGERFVNPGFAALSGDPGRHHRGDLPGLGRGGRQRQVLQHVGSRWQPPDHRAVPAGQADGEQRAPVADQQPAGVVVGRIQPGAHLGDRGRRIRVRGEGQRQLAAGPPGVVPPPRRWLVRQAGQHALGVHRQPGPAGQRVPAAEDPRPAVAQHGDRLGRPGVQLIPVRRHHQRRAVQHPGQRDQQAHACDVTRTPGTKAAPAGPGCRR